MQEKTVTLIANGDLRLSANQACWAEQRKVEEAVTSAIEALGYQVRRGHPYDERKGHGFIDSQKHGREVFRQIDPEVPLIIAFAAWQYSHHVLPGLYTHRAPILTVANWSGTWPGLVGMLNMNGCLAKAGIRYDTLWSEDFSDDFFVDGLRRWLDGERVAHDLSHVKPLGAYALSQQNARLGTDLAERLISEKAIMGVFDEGCMGMYNAIIPDELLHPTGTFKERLSQSSLYYEATQVSDEDALACRAWLEERGMRFVTGSDEENELTDGQILRQLKTYVAALRMADDFGCDLIGIQYQQGLKDLLPASDLAEGLLNNVERPPVKSRDGSRVLYEGRALPHFNEVDECAGLDALVTNRIWTALGYDPETTLHDLRWGEEYDDEFVWTFMISGGAPPRHFEGGYAGASSERQPKMYFRLGGGTCKGVSKPGHVVWSRVFVEDNRLKADLGLAEAVYLPSDESERRFQATTPQWPVMHAVLKGISRDQMMARHRANHIQVAYAPDAEASARALSAKGAMLEALGVEVFICGEV